ncbi:Metallophosphoesterase [Kibdelosporangium sp. 4NS15]|uniref:Metallophosphoesterase n=1 Tax=Kibdelosporangium persicum TaxID=2698649 RepID=A0ABX2FC44_9PSEU|nr:metallophosphoesterase [Kibdelosporangium persicum]NRN68948.1 Metallophosphoesterase [Kibdelosporangium persicum]
MFFLLLGVPAALAHYYLWRRLVRDTTLRGGHGRLFGTVALVGAFVLMMLALVLQRDVAFLAWPGFLWLAFMFYLTLVLGVLEIPRVLVNRRVKAPVMAGADEPDAVPVPSRRVFIARSFAIAGGITAGGIVGYGATKALGAPELSTVPVPIRRLDPSLNGFRIAVVSDIHLGPLAGRGHTERIVQMINQQRPDLVAIVGDLVDGTVEKLGDAAAPLKDLVSKHGSFFVTGNHEYYSGVEPWLTELERLGVNPLRNERVAINRGGASFDLAGVNDVTGGQFEDAPDLTRALAGRDTANPVVLLAHQPIQVEDAARHGVDLQLSGHTHGGQMFPFHLAVPLQQPVTAGLARIDGTWVYVTRGAGFWGPPVRVGAPPEISMIELTP